MGRKKIFVTAAVIIALLGAVVGIILYASGEKEYGEYVLLHTPVGEMYFTEQWEKYTVVEESTDDEEYSAVISAETTSGTIQLYTLHIGSGSEDSFLIGYVNGNEIWVDIPELTVGEDWSDKNINIIYSMQEDLNCMIDQITHMDGYYTQTPNAETPEETEEEFLLLSTPIGEIYCTKQWEDYIAVNETTTDELYTAEITAKTKSGFMPLCTVRIGSGIYDGMLIGYVNGFEAKIDLPEIETDSSWTQADIDIVYEIQESLNCVIDQIKSMEGFRTEEPTDDSAAVIPGQYVMLSTPVGDLYFSEQWKDYLLIEEIAMDPGYMAIISVKTTSGTAALYELYIGTESNAGTLIGSVSGDGIWINTIDADLDKWTAEDIDIAYTIQEELECILDQIIEMT